MVDAVVIELIKGDPDGFSKPGLHQFTSKVIRNSDKKILGVAVGYYRIGGGPDGPWHPSSYTGCTSEAGKRLIREIFTNATKDLR